MDVIFGDAIERTAQFIVGMGWKMRTAESMREAAQKLNGMRTFLTFVGAGLGEDALRLNNEILRCHQVADQLQQEGR